MILVSSHSLRLFRKESQDIIRMVKKMFSLALNSADLTSWTSSISEAAATFRVDPRGILDTQDYGKDYRVYLSFQEVTTTANESMMGLRLDVGGNKLQHRGAAINGITANGQTAYDFHFIGTFQNIATTATSPSLVILKRIVIDREDQGPIIVKSLNRLDYITVTFYSLRTGNIFAYGPYLAILHFEEI